MSQHALQVLLLGLAIVADTDATYGQFCIRLLRGPLAPAEAEQIEAIEWWMERVYAVDSEALARLALEREGEL